MYIAWLCSAVFLHLPSMGKLGLDIKADISILLTTFLVFPFAFSFREAINRCNVVSSMSDWGWTSTPTAPSS